LQSSVPNSDAYRFLVPLYVELNRVSPRKQPITVYYSVSQLADNLELIKQLSENPLIQFDSEILLASPSKLVLRGKGCVFKSASAKPSPTMPKQPA
jgi:hypothetical protein